jgi:hypothetical protein
MRQPRIYSNVGFPAYTKILGVGRRIVKLRISHLHGWYALFTTSSSTPFIITFHCLLTWDLQVDNLSGMLAFEGVIIEEIIQKHLAARAERNSLAQQKDNWGCGYIRSNFAGLLGAFFRGLGKQDRTPGNYPQVPGDDKSARTTEESFHPIARIRKTKLAGGYSPAALGGYVIEGPGNGSGGQTGWQWVKKDVSLAVPEYVLLPDKKMTVTHNLDFVSRPSLSRTLCPKSRLADLDRHNGIAIPASDTTAIQ